MLPKDRAWRLSAAALLLAAAALPAAAADKPCSPAEAALAEKAIDSVTSWAALQRVVRDYRHCDQGPVAELYTDALLRVLISDWPHIAQAEPIFDKDAPFREWTMRRLGSPAIAKDDADSVRGLAKGNCPRGRSRLCDDFLSALDTGKPLALPKLMEPIKPAGDTAAK